MIYVDIFGECKNFSYIYDKDITTPRLPVELILIKNPRKRFLHTKGTRALYRIFEVGEWFVFLIRGYENTKSFIIFRA